MSSRTSVCRACCLPPALLILASPLGCGHSFGLQDGVKFRLGKQLTARLIAGARCQRTACRISRPSASRPLLVWYCNSCILSFVARVPDFIVRTHGER
jgi:hypothetical protein